MSLRAVLPALAAAAAAYYNTKRTDERKAQIERTNDQVRLLYGPLLACVHATRSAYLAMVAQHSPDGTAAAFVRAVRERPEGAEGRAYRCVWVWGGRGRRGCTQRAARASGRRPPARHRSLTARAGSG